MSSVATPSILCVDDETGVLNALKRSFRREPFNVVVTDSPSQALELMTESEFAAVVSDYRMPEMLGTDLLFRIREQHPETRRILLTGEADLGAVMSAVNTGGVHKFFLKPWDNLVLACALRECIEMYSLERENLRLASDLEAANQALSELNQDLTSRLVDTVSRLEENEFYDRQTGLPNGRLLVRNADSQLIPQLAGGQCLVFIALGIHDFPLLQTALGKQACSDLVNAVADGLRDHLRAQDLLARIGKESFCIVTRSDRAPASVERLAHRLLHAVLDRSARAAEQPYFSISAGVEIYEGGEANAEILLDNAVTAMNRARHQAGPTVLFYDNAILQQANSRLSLGNDLYRAVENREFHLNFQPRVDAHSGCIVAAEVLLRWRHPERGPVPPAEFVPVLEETGLIETVGLWVLEEACAAATRLWDAGHPVLLAVNVSPFQLHNADFFTCVRDTIAGVDIPVDRFLELEITESVMVSDTGCALEIVEQLRDLGIRIAIDDFGTGYSSLNYLAKIPADYLKIDKSFVDTLVEKPTTRSIVASILSIAQALDMEVIAEGIESEDQAECLREMGCPQFQGYLYSKPLGEAEFRERLERGDVDFQGDPIEPELRPAMADRAQAN